MNKPKIELNGKTYEMKEPKGKAWRKFAELHENRLEIPNVEFIERHVEAIAENFENLTSNEILENMNLSEVIPIFYKCYDYAASILYSGMKKLDSTEDDSKNETA